MSPKTVQLCILLAYFATSIFTLSNSHNYQSFNKLTSDNFQSITSTTEIIEKESNFEPKQTPKEQKRHQIEKYESTTENFNATENVNQTLQPTGTNWMEFVNDDDLVSKLSIPGTHDSAASKSPMWFNFFISIFWKTQDLSIEEQLSIGVRFFDIRVKCESEDSLTLFHGPIYLGSFEKLINPVKEFLEAHPKEFVIILIQKERGNEDNRTCGNKILSNLELLPRYCFPCKPNKVPQVKELRGKVWIWESFPGGENMISLQGELSIPTYNKNTIEMFPLGYIQNEWEGPIGKKKIHVDETINKPENKLRINFLNGVVIPLLFSPIYNNWFNFYMYDKRPKNIGIIAFDYISKELSQSVFSSNF